MEYLCRENFLQFTPPTMKLTKAIKGKTELSKQKGSVEFFRSTRAKRFSTCSESRENAFHGSPRFYRATHFETCRRRRRRRRRGRS